MKPIINPADARVKTIRFLYFGRGRSIRGAGGARPLASATEHKRHLPMSAHLGHASSLRSTRTRAARASGWSALLGRIATAMETRLQLQELDERMLRDIGMTQHDALREAARAPWDIGPDGKPRGGF
jgi:uncharacterized protein YjiS (DUF1127 family)